MRSRILWVGLAALLAIPAAVRASAPHDYIQGGVGDAAVLVCDTHTFVPGWGWVDTPGIGGVCMPGGHIGADAYGKGSIGALDLNFNPVVGYYCQDNNGNFVCGDGTDNHSFFCGGMVLDSATNWSTGKEVRVQIAGPVWGPPFLNACNGSSNYSGGLLGTVDHS